MYKHSYIIIAVASLLLACEKSEMSGTGLLEDGIWVEAAQRKDTIEFKSFDDSDRTWLVLNRERENRDGYNMPKKGAGIYEYTLKDNAISLYYTLSSYAAFQDFPFQHQGTKIQIGNFYEGTESLKTFVQIANK